MNAHPAVDGGDWPAGTYRVLAHTLLNGRCADCQARRAQVPPKVYAAPLLDRESPQAGLWDGR